MKRVLGTEGRAHLISSISPLAAIALRSWEPNMAAVAEAAAMVRKDRRVGRVIISYLPMGVAEVLPPPDHQSVYCILVSSIWIGLHGRSSRERKRAIGKSWHLQAKWRWSERPWRKRRRRSCAAASS